MDLFRNKEKESIYENFSDYTPIDTQAMHLRRITDEEYAAVPAKNKSKTAIVCTPAGALIALLAIVAVWGEIDTLINFVNNKPRSGVELFIASTLFGTFTLFTVIFTLMKFDRVVTRDTLVNVGQVTRVDVHRGYKGGVYHAYHYIALHGSRQMVRVDDTKEINTSGSTVLIIRSPSCKYYLKQIPNTAVNYSLNEGDHSEEIASISGGSEPDYTDFNKVDIFNADLRKTDPAEFENIPEKYRRARPFGQGVISVIWVMFTAGALLMIYFLIRSYRAHDMMVFAPLMAGFVCELIITLIITSAIFKSPMPAVSAFYTDCIIVSKYTYTGKCMVSILIPDSKQFVESVSVNSSVFKDIPLNVPVRIYFNALLREIEYVSAR